MALACVCHRSSTNAAPPPGCTDSTSTTVRTSWRPRAPARRGRCAASGRLDRHLLRPQAIRGIRSRLDQDRQLGRGADARALAGDAAGTRRALAAQVASGANRGRHPGKPRHPNARALVLGGRALGDAAALERGLALLGRELPEQVLSDGGHYERSPVYHLVVLRDLLEVRAASEAAGLDEPIERIAVRRRPPAAGRRTGALQRRDARPRPAARPAAAGAGAVRLRGDGLRRPPLARALARVRLRPAVTGVPTRARARRRALVPALARRRPVVVDPARRPTRPARERDSCAAACPRDGRA